MIMTNQVIGATYPSMGLMSGTLGREIRRQIALESESYILSMMVLKMMQNGGGSILETKGTTKRGEGPQEKRHRIALDIAKELGREDDVIAVILEGEVGRGEARSSSGIDLLCVTTKGSNRESRFFFKEGIPVGVAIESEDKLGSLDNYRKWSIVHAESICDPQNLISGIKKEWEKTIPLGDNTPQTCMVA